MNAATSPPLLSRKQAAEFLGLAPQTLAAWATNKRYDLPYVHVGRLVKYRIADLERFITSRTVGALE